MISLGVGRNLAAGEALVPTLMAAGVGGGGNSTTTMEKYC